MLTYATDPYEIKSAINKRPSNKARGYDNILPFFFKTAADVIAFLLANIVNKCTSLGTFPNKLIIAKVLYINQD